MFPLNKTWAASYLPYTLPFVRLAKPDQVPNPVRKTILDIEGNLPITNASSLGELIDAYNASTRMDARLCTIFGMVALLAASGTYGVLSYGVARRTNEIGIRMALGAERPESLA